MLLSPPHSSYADVILKWLFCCRIWIDSDRANSDDDMFLKAKHLQEAAVDYLRVSPVQRVLSRAVYSTEYEASLLDCMKGTRACTPMLSGHRQHVRTLLKNTKVASFVDILRKKCPVAVETYAAGGDMEILSGTVEDDGPACQNNTISYHLQPCLPDSGKAISASASGDASSSDDDDIELD